MRVFSFTASLPPNMGDSILDSLSLPLSGRVASKQPKITTGDKTSFITPVFGLISNDVPVMASATKRMLRNDEQREFTSVKEKSSGMKRKQPGGSQSEPDQEGDEVLTRSGRKEMSGRSRNEARVSKKCRGEENEEEGAAKMLHLPQDLYLSQARVVIKKLPESAIYPDMSGRGGKPSLVKASVSKTTSSQPQKPDLDCPGLDNKE